MKGKKLMNHIQASQQAPSKLVSSKMHPKRRFQEVRSNEPKLKLMLPPTVVLSQNNIRPQFESSAVDYDFHRHQRQTLNYIPIGQSQVSYPPYRSQRNSEVKDLCMQRQNHFINQNSNACVSSTHSQQGSLKKIKVFSAENNDKSWARSDNSSVKRKAGIGLTKTLLKRISGMYTEKDFQNKSSIINKCTKEETTGIMTMTMSGRGACDQYQISDFDFAVSNNHTFNTSNQNGLSFNDSGNWKRVNENNMHFNLNEMQQSYESNLKRSTFQQKPVRYAVPNNRLVKMKSFDLLNNDRPISQSIVIGNEPPPQQTIRRDFNNLNASDQRYMIRSKGKTLDQLSVKQSMVIGFDNYY